MKTVSNGQPHRMIYQVARPTLANTLDIARQCNSSAILYARQNLRPFKPDSTPIRPDHITAFTKHKTHNGTNDEQISNSLRSSLTPNFLITSNKWSMLFVSQADLHVACLSLSLSNCLTNMINQR